ncbi:hypothetical protein ACXZ65_34550 [Streptomyces aculeolatus]
MEEEHLWTRVPVVPDDITTSVGGFAAVCSCGAKSKPHSTFTGLYREMNEHVEEGSS